MVHRDHTVRLPEHISGDLFRSAMGHGDQGSIRPIHEFLARRLRPGDTIWLCEDHGYRSERFVRRTITNVVVLHSGIRIIYHKDGSHYWFEVNDEAREASAWVVTDPQMLAAHIAQHQT